MAVLNNISVGDIEYYVVDSKPIHSAEKGSIAIVPEYDVMYRNNDGGTTWIRLMCDDVYMHGYFVANPTGRDTTQGSFTNLNTLGWVLGESNGFSHPIAGELTYTGSTDITVFTKLTGTIEADGKWQDYEIISAFNNTVQPMYQGGTGKPQSKRVTIANNQVHNFVTNDYLNVGVRFTARQAGGGASSRTYIPTDFSYTAEKIDEVISIETPIFNEDFESSGFTANSWTIANDTDNIWVVGQAVSVLGDVGLSSAYITTNASAGAAATYVGDGVGDSISSIYKDFVFPVADTITLTFEWGAAGSNTDFGAVIIESTATTVTGGVRNLATVAPAGGDGRIGGDSGALGAFNSTYNASAASSFVTETIDLTAYAGETKRLIFEWFNNSATDTPPGFLLDNITISAFDNL